jgi:hypothetical protein
MIRSLVSTLIALLIIGAFAVTAQADTIPVSGTLTGTSILTPTSNPAVFDETFSGTGVDSAAGLFAATNMGTLTFSSPTVFTAVGTFMDVFAGGTLFGTFSESGTTASDGSSSTVTLTTVTGGTGAFAGDTGASTTIGTNTPTDMPPFSGTYTGFITTPEPSSLVLMLAGIGLLPLMRKR